MSLAVGQFKSVQLNSLSDMNVRLAEVSKDISPTKDAQWRERTGQTHLTFSDQTVTMMFVLMNLSDKEIDLYL